MHHHPHRFKWACYKKWNGKPRLASIIWRWDAWKDEVLDDFPSKAEKGPSSIRWSLKLKGNIGKTDERQVAPLKKRKRLTRVLPVKFRCQYKIATLAYRYFEGSLPPYFSSSLCTYEPSRFLRSSNEKLLKIPKRNLKSFGQRSFSFMAPSPWNSLPATLRNAPTLSQFRTQLKSFLFAQAFL